jgi:hypothetical protein
MAVCPWCRGEMTAVESCLLSHLHVSGRHYDLARYGSDGHRSGRSRNARRASARTGRASPGSPGSTGSSGSPGSTGSTGGSGRAPFLCVGCNVERGLFHHPGCPEQRCPRCHGRLVSCGCRFDEHEYTDEQRFEWLGRQWSGLDHTVFELEVRHAFAEFRSRLPERRVPSRRVTPPRDNGAEAAVQMFVLARFRHAWPTLPIDAYGEFDLVEVEGMTLVTPLRALIDRASTMDRWQVVIELLDHCGDPCTGSLTAAWHRLNQPDMVDHQGAAMMRACIPADPRLN